MNGTRWNADSKPLPNLGFSGTATAISWPCANVYRTPTPTTSHTF